MLMRLRHGRRAQFYAKLAACLLVAAFYFAILIRESLNAFEQNKEKAAMAALLLSGGSNGVDGSDSSSTIQKTKTGPQLRKTKRKLATSVLQQKSPPPLTTPPTATLASTLNPVYEYSEEIHSATERDLERRHAHLGAVCSRYDLQSRYPPNPWEFFISPGHNLVWCNVFKAASSTWLYYFNILGGYDIPYLQRTETQPLELARKRFPRPELAELRDSLPAALSFLFVRDPFERIVSAYRNKLEGGRNSFYKVLGHHIVQQQRRRAAATSSAAAAAAPVVASSSAAASDASGVGVMAGAVAAAAAASKVGAPTFTQFLHYLIDQHARGKRFDEHWAPVYSFCTPCFVNFTIIGKLETFQRDSEFIIRQAGLESLLLGKLPRHKLRKIGNLAKGVKTDTIVARYFGEIDRNTLDQLLNIYRLDFELFNYDYSKYYSLVQPSLSGGGGGDSDARSEHTTGVSTNVTAVNSNQNGNSHDRNSNNVDTSQWQRH